MTTTLQFAQNVQANVATRYTVEYDGWIASRRARSRLYYALDIARISGATVTHTERRIRRGVWAQAISATGTSAQLIALSTVQDTLEIG